MEKKTPNNKTSPELYKGFEAIPTPTSHMQLTVTSKDIYHGVGNFSARPWSQVLS